MLEDIRKDIDETLNQLMQNAEAIKHAKATKMDLLEHLESLQESLLARLMNRQALLDEEKIQSIPKVKIKEKAVEINKRQKPASRRKARSRSSG